MPRRVQPSPERDDKAAQFATALADALHGLKLTHKKLAEVLGITLHSVDSWTRTNAPNLPSEENLRKLCDLLDTRQAGLGQRLHAILNPQRVLPAGHAPAASTHNPETAHSNLRVPATSFIGRRAELTQIVEQLSSLDGSPEPCRLLTLLGPGGIGKTRLALQAATELVAEFEDGLWWVELANISGPALIWQALASVLGVREESGRALAESVVQRLHRRHALLILDNSEHLTAACAALCERLLRECPSLQLLVTTREALQLREERVMALSTLSLPPLADRAAWGVARKATNALPVSRSTPNAQRRTLNQYDATRLFIERAFFQQLGFAITENNAPVIINICHRLDGIALAIELAAACLPQLSVEQISAKLADRFNLLTRGSQTVLPRHQTLRATIAWSYDLLSDDEQLLFARLSVFHGGWHSEAAQAITQDGAPVDRQLAQFNNKSLIVLEERSGRLRYRMLESIGDYARERLHELDAAVIYMVADQHAGYFTQWVEQQQADLTGAHQQRTIEALESDHDNLRSALVWSRQHQPELNLRLCAALWRFWLVRGYLSEGRGHLAWALAHTTEQVSLQRAAVLNGAGALARQQMDYELAYAFYTQSLGMYRQIDHAPGIAQVLNDLGIVVTSRGDHAQARALYEESAALWRKLGHSPGVATSLLGLSLIAYSVQDYPAARHFCEESLVVAQQANDPLSTLRALNALGEVARTQGDYARAETCYNDSLQLSETLGHRWGNAAALHNLGYVEKHLGKWADAAHCFQQSLVLYQDLEDQRGIAACLCGLGIVRIASGQHADGLRTLAAAQSLLQQADGSLTHTEQSEYEAAIQTASQQLDVAHYQSIWREGQSMSAKTAIALA